MKFTFQASIKLAQLLAFLFLLQPAFAQVVNQSVTSAQLVVNPGAETVTVGAPSSYYPGGTYYPTGWTNVGPASFVADNGVYDNGCTPHSGSYQFVCAQTSGSAGHIYQNIDVTTFLTGTSIPGVNSGNLQASSIATIDSSAVTANFSFWQHSMNQGGWGDYNSVTLNFLDGSGTLLGTYSSPNQDNVTAWTYCAYSTPVPFGTRTIRYIINSYLNSSGGAWMDAFVDDNSLTLSSSSVTISNLTVVNSQVNLIVNGGFETGEGTTPAGWTCPDGFFHPKLMSELPGIGGASNQLYILQMGDPNESTISQSFTSVPGATYTLSFNYAGDWQSSDPAQLFYVQWNGSDINEPPTGTPGAYLTSSGTTPYRLVASQVSSRVHSYDPLVFVTETVPGLVATGTTTTLTFGGKRWYEYLDNVSVVLTALPTQTISFNAPLSQQYSTTPISLRATASSGLPVTFSIVSGSATVTGSNVTITGLGHIIVRASQAGSSNWAPAADVDMGLDISIASQSITFPTPADVPYSGTTHLLSASADSSLPITFSKISGPITVTGSTFTATGAGQAVIRASQAGNTLYNAAPNVDGTFNVTANKDSWKLSKFTTPELAIPSVSGDLAIYSHDGLTNLMKYAMGLDPKTNCTTKVPNTTTDHTNWIYNYSIASGLPDVTITVQRSSDLVNWYSTGMTMNLVSSSNGIDTWTATYPVASHPILFFRLKVTNP